MRLTNEMRKDFAAKVVAKIPVKHTMTRDKIADEISNRLTATWPKDVLNFYKKYPSLINTASYYIEWLSHRDPDGEFRSGLARSIIGSEMDRIEVADLKAHYRNHVAEQSERIKMEKRIYDQACGCTTLAQLEVVFPDLKGLMPKPVVNVKHLPVAAKGLTDDLVKLGLEIPQ